MVNQGVVTPWVNETLYQLNDSPHLLHPMHSYCIQRWVIANVKVCVKC